LKKAIMDITQIMNLAGRHKRRRRLGRGHGSGSGKTCGRGHNGGGSRAGWKRRGMAEGGQMPIFRRLPKRGFNNADFETRYNIVNVSDLERCFDAGESVCEAALFAAGLIRRKNLALKVLGDGGLTKALTVEAAKFSKQALEKITAAGGQAKVVQSTGAAS